MGFLDFGPRTSADARKATYSSLVGALMLFAMAFAFSILQRSGIFSYDEPALPTFATAIACAVGGALLAIAVSHRATYQRLNAEGK